MFLLSYTCANLTVYNVILKETPISIQPCNACSHFTHFRVTLETSCRQSEEKQERERERRETESPITFSISGRTGLSSGSRRTLAGTRTDYQPHNVRGQVAFFSSQSSFLPPHLLFSYAKDLTWIPCTSGFRVEKVLHVDQIAKVLIALVHAIEIITKYPNVMWLRIHPE